MTVHATRVLCVDDVRDIADTEVMVLRLLGYEARACYDGDTAWAVYREFRPNACLIDLNMPGMDGCELARLIRAEPASGTVVLIAVTARSTPGDERRTAAAGFDCHLVKPTDPRVMAAALKGLVLRGGERG